ncbi:SRPBCC family protein [Streptomyces sp. NPDC058001]|uniref:SRPBCC family protein n=1 Tax=Streptomyces sp. NPDC058001 TaxID=3346300 RepID=UPI0036E2B563
MAIRHQLIGRDPATVWRVLKNPARYADWVVGTARSTPRSGNWPDVGSSLSYTVTLASKRFDGHTVVRRFEPPRHLELEAHSPLGTARIALDVRTWGEETLVILDEHPLRGPAGKLHNAVLDAVLQFRHRAMLSRLASVVEREDSRIDTRGEGTGS